MPKLASMVALSGLVIASAAALVGEFIAPPLDYYGRTMRQELRFGDDRSGGLEIGGARGVGLDRLGERHRRGQDSTAEVEPLHRIRRLREVADLRGEVEDARVREQRAVARTVDGLEGDEFHEGALSIRRT